jgi:hypothetical protein
MDDKLDDYTTLNHIPENYLVDLNLRLDALEKKRKRKRLLYLWFPVLLLSGIGLGMYQTLATNLTPIKVSVDKALTHEKHSNPDSTHKSIQKQNSLSRHLDPTPKASLPSKPTSSTTLLNIETQRKQTIQYTAPEAEIVTVGLNEVKVAIAPFDSTFSNIEMPSKPIEFMIHSQEISKISLHRIDTVLMPILEPFQAAKTQVSRKRMLGFSSGVSGIISSFTPMEYPVTSYLNLTYDNYKSYAQARKEAERATSSLDLSVFYRQQAKHWFYQVGIAYNEWGEQIVYPFNSIDGTNRYRYLNLPLFGGYQWTKNKVSLSPMLGLSAGIKLSGTGYYLMPNGVVDIVEAQTFSTSGMAQIELAYHLNPFIFHFTPGIRSSISSPVKSAVTKNHYQAIGCQIGFIYLLEHTRK